MSHRIRQLFKTSESDREENKQQEYDKDKKLKDEKNRKWLRSSKSKFPISKDEKKVKNFEGTNSEAKNKSTNQSNFFLVINSENLDEIKNESFTYSNDNDKSLKRLDKIFLNDECLDENEKHLYENEFVIVNNLTSINEPIKANSIDEHPIQLNKNQQVKKHTKFTPKPFKLIKKKINEFKHFQDSSTSAISPNNDLSTNQLNMSSQPNSPLNSQLNVPNEAHLNENSNKSSSDRNQRRRKNTFISVADRLDYLQSTTSNDKKSKKSEIDELKPNHFRSEDNLLSRIPEPPRSIIKLNPEEKPFLKAKEDNHTKLIDYLYPNQRLLSENLIYQPLESIRLNGSIELSKHNYINYPVFEESNSRPRKCDLTLLRQYKPQKFCIPNEEKKPVNYVNLNLTYVNLIFNGNEQSNDISKSMSGDLRSNSTTSTSSNNSSSSTDPDIVSYLTKSNVFKSTDSKLNRSIKSTNSKQQNRQLHKQQSKSDDESASSYTTKYSKIDWIATNGLRNTRDYCEKRNHHL